MSRRTVLLSTVSTLALSFVVPITEPDGWYGAIDAGYTYLGDLIQ